MGCAAAHTCEVSSEGLADLIAAFGSGYLAT